MFLFGFLLGIAFYQTFEWFILNYVLLRNLDLFNDLMLSKKNSKKLKKYYGGVK